MARIPLTLALLAIASPAVADVAEAVAVITPAYRAVADNTAALDKASAADCAPESLRPPFQEAWDDWARIDFLRIGPVEEKGRGLAMAFWPDPKSSGLRAQQAVLDDGAALADRPADFAQASVAMRGFAGLERLLYGDALKGTDDARCRLTRATTADLARMGREIAEEWPAHAELLTNPRDDNPAYLTQTEARQAIYTQIMTGLESLEETRLGRPMGTFDKPRPERAEAMLSGRSLRNVTLSLEGLRDVALAFYPEAPATKDAFDRALKLARDLDDPVLAGIGNPQGRLKVEILQQAIGAIREAVAAEAGAALGVSTGFNSKDGD